MTVFLRAYSPETLASSSYPSDPQQQTALPAQPETVPAAPIREELANRHRLIKVLLSRHESLINARLRRFVKQFPEIGDDAVRSTFYLKLVKRCIHRDDLIELQNHELQTLNRDRERQIIGGLIKFTKLEELKRLRRGGRCTRVFSQMNEYNPGQIAGDTLATHEPETPRSLAVRIADRLSALKIDLSDRQFNILLLRIHNSSDPSNLTPYEEIASQLNISMTTVTREMAKVTRKILTARGVTDTADSPATIARREDYKLILASDTNLKPALKAYLETYVALTENGQRPTEERIREELGLTPGQLKSRQRVAARLRPGLLREDRAAA